MFYYLPKSLRKWSADPVNLKGKLFPGKPNDAIPSALKWVMHEIKKDNDFSADSTISFSSKNSIIAIGDVVSNGLLSLKLNYPTIKYCFYDNKTQRDAHYSIPTKNHWTQKKFSNPAGAVSQEIINFVKDTWSDLNSYMVEIKGEEDIIVVATVLNCLPSYIFYGQPPLPYFNPPIPAGCVVIKVNSEVQSHFQEIFKKMSLEDSVI